jgi:hypothetical protein
MTALEDLTRDYRAAFLRYVAQRSEAALTVGYQLGRQSVERGTGLLDLVQVHHEVLAEVLAESPADSADLASAASEFLLEVVSTFDMAQRRLQD